MVLLSHTSLFVDSTPLAVRGPVETEPVNVLFPPIVCALVVSTLLLRVVARSVLFSEMDGTARDWGMVTAPVEAIVKAWRLKPLAMAKFPAPTPPTECPIVHASPAEVPKPPVFLKKVILL